MPKEYFGEGLDEEIRAAVEKALDGLRAAGMRREAGESAAHQVCGADLLRDCDGGGEFESVAVRWGEVWVKG